MRAYVPTAYRPSHTKATPLPPGTLLCYGGAFNPIHKGHIAVARALRDSFQMHDLMLMPSFHHPFDKAMESFTHRVNMCREALTQCFPNDAFIGVWDIEARNPTGLTIDLLPLLPQKRILVIGLDNALAIDKWTRHKEVIASTPFIVVDRPESTSLEQEPPHRKLSDISLRHSTDLSTAQGASAPEPKPTTYRSSHVPKDSWFLKPPHQFLRISIPISSSDIRLRLYRNDPIAQLVPSSVVSYIAQHKLYRL